jgi:hypothetical protein
MEESRRIPVKKFFGSFFRRAAFIIAILLFFVSLAVLAYSMIEIGRLRIKLADKEKLLTSINADRKYQDREVVAMKNEIGQLRAQKALYTATIETLSKKE